MIGVGSYKQPASKLSGTKLSVAAYLTDRIT